MCDTICFIPEKECDLQQRQHSQKQLHFHVFLQRNDKLLADAVKNVSRNVPFSIRGELPSRQHFKNNGVPIHCVAFLLKEADFQTTGHLLVMPVFVEIKEFDPKYCKAIWFLSLFSFLLKPQSKAKVTRLFTHFLTAISFAVVYISIVWTPILNFVHARTKI